MRSPVEFGLTARDEPDPREQPEEPAGMTRGWLRCLEGRVVLAGVKAKPPGWPAGQP